MCYLHCTDGEDERQKIQVISGLIPFSLDKGMNLAHRSWLVQVTEMNGCDGIKIQNYLASNPVLSPLDPIGP